MIFFLSKYFLIQRAHACFMGVKLSSLVVRVPCVPLIQFIKVFEPYPFFSSLAPARLFLHLLYSTLFYCTNQMRPAFKKKIKKNQKKKIKF